MKFLHILLTAALAAPLASAPPLAFKKEGHGPGVVLIHGFGGNREVWADMVKRLKGGHTVVTLDLPGHGESAPPPLKEGESDLEAIATEVAQLIVKEKVSPAIVVGHSIGGAVAIRVAVADRKAVRGVILVDSTLTPLAKAYVDDFLKDLDANSASALGEFIGDLCNGDAQKEKLVKEAVKVPLPVLKAYATTLGRDSFSGRGPSVRVPVTLFASTTLVPDPANEKESLKQLGLEGVPKLTVSYFVNVKHWIMLDDPDTFEVLFNDFENSLEGSNSGRGNRPR